MRIVLISDTHGMHNRMLHPVPDGDVLVHCGDMTGYGTLREVANVAAWMAAKPHRYKIAVAGNHDASLEPGHTAAATQRAIDAARQLWDRGIIYLRDASTEIEGVKFYGSPWTPEFMDWHFMLPRHSPELKAKWDAIPGDVQVLITHGPAHGVLDWSLYDNEPVGCELLRLKVQELTALKLHAFGHIHEGYGMAGQYNEGGPLRVNAAICNRNYEPVNKPVVVDL